jgi:hypothetical protein
LSALHDNIYICAFIILHEHYLFVGDQFLRRYEENK